MPLIHQGEDCLRCQFLHWGLTITDDGEDKHLIWDCVIHPLQWLHGHQISLLPVLSWLGLSAPLPPLQDQGQGQLCWGGGQDQLGTSLGYHPPKSWPTALVPVSSPKSPVSRPILPKFLLECFLWEWTQSENFYKGAIRNCCNSARLFFVSC